MAHYEYYLLVFLLIAIGFRTDSVYKKLHRLEAEVDYLRKKLCPSSYDRVIELENLSPGASLGTQVYKDWKAELEEQTSRGKG